MDELYKMIEERIEASGYPGHIDGEAFYEDISEEVGDKEPGEYMFLIRKDDQLSYSGSMEVLEDQFDLHYVDIILGDDKYRADFS